MRLVLCCGLFAVMGSLIWAADEPAVTKISATTPLEKLIDLLGHRDFKTRQAAVKAIEERGLAALTALQKAKSHHDAEVRRRVDELLPPLERIITTSSKRLSLRVDQKPLKDVIEALAKESGYKINSWNGSYDPPDAAKTFSFQFENAPFWEALDKICETVGMTVQQSGDETIRLQFQDAYAPYKYYHGAFKVTATGFNYHRNTNFAQLPKRPANNFAGQSHESLQLNLTVAVEPKTPILKLGRPRVTSAEDNDGRNMLPNGNGQINPWEIGYYYGGYGRTFIQSTSVPLVWPAKESRAVRRIRGIIPVTLLAEQKPLVISDKILSAKGQKIKLGTAEFHIEDVATVGRDSKNKQYQLKINFSEDQQNQSWDYSRIQTLQQRVELYDDKGNKYPTYVGSMNFMSPTNAQFQLTTQPQPTDSKLGTPAKLVYLSWVQLDYEVPFEFRDLPLP